MVTCWTVGCREEGIKRLPHDCAAIGECPHWFCEADAAALLETRRNEPARRAAKRREIAFLDRLDADLSRGEP